MTFAFNGCIGPAIEDQGDGAGGVCVGEAAWRSLPSNISAHQTRSDREGLSAIG